MEKSAFGITSKGEQANKYTISNASGSKIVVTDFGATLVSVVVPDKNGKMIDVVLGYDDVSSYENNGNFCGAIVGRNCNRTEGASYRINDTLYHMDKNENDNNLHSGAANVAAKLWKVKTFATDYITFSYHSPDGEGGFPGDFDIDVTYSLTEDNQVKIHYDGIADQDTIANMTNHSYFNLSGHDSGNILDQTLWMDADAFTVLKTGSIATGDIWTVEGTPMDFRVEKTIGNEIDADYEQLILTGGYDHNYVLNKQGCGIRLIARAKSPVTGIAMECYTDTVGVQFYTGNFISGPVGKNGVNYDVRQGFCLETQYYPNAANISHFPSPILKKGKKYDSTTIYKFNK